MTVRLAGKKRLVELIKDQWVSGEGGRVESCPKQTIAEKCVFLCRDFGKYGDGL